MIAMIELTIKLNKRQTEAIANGEQILINILPPSKTRAENMIADVRQAQAPKEISVLVNEWNSHPYILEVGPSEGRNNPIPNTQVRRDTLLFNKTIEKFGLQKLIDMMHKYFEACQKGEHIGNTSDVRRNHGYSHLGGFIKKIWDTDGDKTKLWYMRREAVGTGDKNPQLTLRIANEYAKRWLGRNKYGLIPNSAEYKHFERAAKWVIAYEKSGKEREMIIKVWLDDVAQRYNDMGGKVSPDRLASDNCWKIYFPQAWKIAISGV